jgi:hypothetical protein
LFSHNKGHRYGFVLQPATFTTTAHTVPVGQMTALPQINDNGMVSLMRLTILKVGEVSTPTRL